MIFLHTFSRDCNVCTLIFFYDKINYFNIIFNPNLNLDILFD